MRGHKKTAPSPNRRGCPSFGYGRRCPDTCVIVGDWRPREIRRSAIPTQHPCPNLEKGQIPPIFRCLKSFRQVVCVQERTARIQRCTTLVRRHPIRAWLAPELSDSGYIRVDRQFCRSTPIPVVRARGGIRLGRSAPDVAATIARHSVHRRPAVAGGYRTRRFHRWPSPECCLHRGWWKGGGR